MHNSSMPRLEKSPNGGHVLVVRGKPFLMLGAELHNSSFSCPRYMSPIWQQLKDCYVNTVLASVTWEAIEPSEGTFEFAKLDQVILDARSNGLHLILLWFGAFKNGKSTYAPSWVKVHSERFPRVELRNKDGTTRMTDTLSVFSPDLVESDAAAFRALMRHVRAIDEEHFTVLMIQVENEVGILGDSRDNCAEANRHYGSPVPDRLLKTLRNEWQSLHPRLRYRLRSKEQMSCNAHASSWPDTFGRGSHTDELFMAYHFTRYVDTVAGAGKDEYALPMFTNVWQNYGDEDRDLSQPTIVGGGGQPGDYPSGGAVIDVLDIWQLFSTSLDFIAPDIYLNDYDAICVKYRHRGQPLFIPEQRRDEYGARRVWSAYGNHGALCASPFGIDTLPSTENVWRRHYRILSQAAEYVLDAQQHPGSSFGFFFDELVVNAKAPESLLSRLGEWDLMIERSFVFGKPGPGFGMVIQLGSSRFMLLGEGFQVRFSSIVKTSRLTGILSLIEKTRDEGSGELVDGRMLNGDETRHGEAIVMPNAEIDYGDFPIAITVPARTGIAVCEVYTLF